MESFLEEVMSSLALGTELCDPKLEDWQRPLQQ